jgi:cyanophycinase-like exopeptidase
MPGTVTMFGSGETSNIGGRVYDTLARQMTAPIQISVLETPAGFEANAERVAGRISDFLTARLQNYQPQLHQVAARKKGTPYSPDSPDITAPLYESELIFLGPGSPTYTVRQLQNSLAWNILQARHRLGANVVFASAATIAAGVLALPVYEIFKAGEDLHWKPGLDFFAPYGLDLVIIPHWNNQDGGADLDTSRCFMGGERFEQLLSLLSEGKTILGIDEMTAVTLDFQAGACQVAGLGSIHLLHGDEQREYAADSGFPIQDLGDFLPLSALETGLPDEVWQIAQQAAARRSEEAAQSSPDDQTTFDIPLDVEQMVAARETARQRRDWARADELRQQIADSGWQIIDSPDGPQVQPGK